MNAADEYKETVKRARAAESIADELAIWREFVAKTDQQSSLREAALGRIKMLKAMEASA